MVQRVFCYLRSLFSSFILWILFMDGVKLMRKQQQWTTPTKSNIAVWDAYCTRKKHLNFLDSTFLELEFFKYSLYRVKAVQTVTRNGNYYAMYVLSLSNKRTTDIFYNQLHTFFFFGMFGSVLCLEVPLLLEYVFILLSNFLVHNI